MHKVEIRLTNEGNDAPAANFEVYTEALKDGAYVDMAPMRYVISGDAPIVMFLEDSERVVIVAKANVGRMIYDKEQNANVRVETEDEVKSREQREANVTKSQAQQSVRNAQAKAGEAQELANKSVADANREVRKAEASAKPTLTPGSTSGTIQPGAPASANTGPTDSKQVKK